jgi:hypothetical protein
LKTLSGRWSLLRAGSLTGLLLAGFFAIFSATYFEQRPEHNWDMIAYIAVALVDAGEPAATVHDKTYDIVKTHIPKEHFATLTEQGDYRKLVAADAARFQDQLPFYSVKPVYPALMSILNRLGVDLVTASVAISAAAYAGIFFLLYIWISRWLRPIVALPIMILLSLCPFFTFIARISTPDSLSVLALLLGAFFVFEMDVPTIGAFFYILSIAIRPENIIYAVLLLLYLAAIRRISRGRFAILLAATAGLYFVLVRLSHNYGWSTLFYYTYYDDTIDLNGFVSSLSWFDYLMTYIRQVDKMIFLSTSGFSVFVLLGLGAFLLKWSQRFEPGRTLARDPYFHLILVAAVFMSARTVAFPGESTRALLSSYFLLTIAFIQSCAVLAARKPGNTATPGSSESAMTWRSLMRAFSSEQSPFSR